MIKTHLLLIYLVVVSFLFNPLRSQVQSYDIVIYGGTSAGAAAAIQASRLKKSGLLIVPENRLGGLTTGGLGQTDIGNKQAIGGISREFYERIYEYYENPDNWNWEKKEEYSGVAYSRTEDGENTRWTFEPSAALKVYHDMMDEQNITIVYGERLEREKGIHKNGTVIATISMENGNTYAAKMFIDATYEGDLMALAGVSYTVGREANEQYGETLNGVQANKYSVTLRGRVARNGRNHNFLDAVDPYRIQGDPSSGLLPHISDTGPGIDGKEDDKIQAYCFRMTLTDHPDNRIPFEKPADYNEEVYELLFRNYEAADNLETMYDYGNIAYLPWANSAMPNRKTDTNNKHGFSTDFIGQSYAYPEGTYEEREAIVEKHREYQKGLMWTLAYHPRIPEIVREEVSQWGTFKDEYDRDDGWPEQLYIREARRMVSDYVMTQHHCEGFDAADDPIGLAAYGMDSHHVQRYVDANGFVKNEGNVQGSVAGPYPISYRSIIPKENEASNLLVPVCLSATHIAFGSIRMEPVFMVLGQSAAIAGSLAIDQKKRVQDLPFATLKPLLVQNGQRLENKQININKTDPK